MPEEGFLRRWARVKASGGEAAGQAPSPVPSPAPNHASAPVQAAAPARVSDGVPAQGERVQPPTLEDAARLTPESDFSAFVSRHVDPDVRRTALKKLFADPHFNVPDRLDMYMDDYNQPSPVSAAMLAGLEHARSALRRPEEVQAELARLASPGMPATTDALPAAGAAQTAGIEAPADGPAEPDTAVRFETASCPSAAATDSPPVPQAPDTHMPAAHFTQPHCPDAPPAEPVAVPGAPAGKLAPRHPAERSLSDEAGTPIALPSPHAHNAGAHP